MKFNWKIFALKSLKRFKFYARNLYRIVIRTGREFFKDQCIIRSASLSFSTLLAGIPLATFILSLFTAFGGLEDALKQITAFTVDMLMPTRQDELMILIDEFVANSRTLGVVGLAIFAFTSINLLNTITKNLNALWGSRQKSNFIGKFTTYTSVLIFGTLLISVSFTFRSVLDPILTPLKSPIWDLFLLGMPTMLMFLVFLLLIMIVPATRVQARYALVGALVGVVFWELAKFAFVNITNYAIRASIMYGSLAAVIIFLFWVNITWVIILTTSELTYTLQNRNRPWSGLSVREMDPSGRVYMGLTIYSQVAAAFHKREIPLDHGRLANRLGLSLKDVEFLCDLFINKGYLLSVGKDERGLIPAGSLEEIRMAELVKILIGGWPEEKSLRGPLADLLRRMDSGVSESLGALTVRQFLEESELIDSI